MHNVANQRNDAAYTSTEGYCATEQVGGPAIPSTTLPAISINGYQCWAYCLPSVSPSRSEQVDLAQLYATHAPSLYRYLVQLTGDADVAADLVQDTFLRVVTHAPTNGALRGWLFRVATNAARDQWRVNGRRAALLDRAAPDELHVGQPRDPEAEFSRRERRRHVQAALATLVERDRVALLMREEGFTHAEIAEAIGTTPKSVGTVIARALVRFARGTRHTGGGPMSDAMPHPDVSSLPGAHLDDSALVEHLDGELDEADRDRYDRHLAECANCAAPPDGAAQDIAATQ